MTPSPEVIQSIVNLRANRDWQVFITHLQALVEDHTSNAIYSNTSEVVFQRAAMARSLRELEKTIQTASSVLRQLKSKGNI